MATPSRVGRARAPVLAALVLAVLALACGDRPAPLPAPEPDASSRRTPPAGAVVGFTGRYGSHVWLGLPYAAPPVGARRWRAPEPAPRWRGERVALERGAPCPQYASVYGGAERGATGVIGDEDCLVLDVWAPRMEPEEAAQARLPVMVWIHGGGNSIGSSAFYDGGHLAQSQGVVVVAIQYRLGPLGWLHHAALRAQAATAEERSGNFGTLDTIQALRWVRDNVAAFGGDPHNVTIFGESAGGTNVLALLLAPSAAGLFQRAILQSAGMGLASASEAEHFRDDPQPGGTGSASEAIAQMRIADGRAVDRAAARAQMQAMAPEELVAWLRSLTPEQLLAGYPEHSEGMLHFPSVARDGHLIPDGEPLELLAAGRYNQVPVILGTNRDENKLFMAFDPELARWRFGMVPQALDADVYEAHARALANAWKAEAVDEPARRMRAVQGPSVFAYRFDWDEEPSVPLLYDGPAMLGASHGFEIPFVFGHWDLGPESDRLFTRTNRAGREALSAAMQSYWTQFAATGAPGRGRRGELPEWTPWDDGSELAPKYAVLDTPAGGGPRMASETWTIERVVSEVLADPRLAEPRARCGVLRALALWGNLPREEYARVGDGVCAPYAFDAYPWRDVVAAGGR
ncbi:MAG TPA: carboxylesterase family protein [Myxococcota bacterium]